MAARGDGNHLGALPLRQLHGEMTDSPPAAPLTEDAFTRQRHRPMRPRLQRIRHLMPGIDHELPGRSGSDIGTAAAC